MWAQDIQTTFDPLIRHLTSQNLPPSSIDAHSQTSCYRQNVFLRAAARPALRLHCRDFSQRVAAFAAN